MALMKLTIFVETAPQVFKKRIKALFNPETISVGKSTNWRMTPKLETDTSRTQFTFGDPAVLALDLFFDTYEQQRDVREYTNEIYALTTIQRHGELHRPPLCRLEWGSFNLSETFDCEWVLESLQQQFSLFLAHGTPVRARLQCTFKQWRGTETEMQLLDLHSADVHKVRIVRAGDSLSQIAAEEYGAPDLWREIARANDIVNPRVLAPGRILDIPTLAKPTHRPRRGTPL